MSRLRFSAPALNARACRALPCSPPLQAHHLAPSCRKKPSSSISPDPGYTSNMNPVCIHCCCNNQLPNNLIRETGSRNSLSLQMQSSDLQKKENKETTTTTKNPYCKRAAAQHEVGREPSRVGRGQQLCSSHKRERAKAAPKGKQLQAIIGRGCHVETFSLFKV